MREGKNLRGRALELAVGTLGKRSLGQQFDKTVKAIEARNGGGENGGIR